MCGPHPLRWFLEYKYPLLTVFSPLIGKPPRVTLDDAKNTRRWVLLIHATAPF